MDRKQRLNRAKDFSFVNPWIRYFLFFFSFVFWVFSLLIVAVGVYAKIQKATDAVRNTFLIDPAVILIVFSLSLTLVFLTQLAIAVLGFFYSEQTVINTMCGFGVQTMSHLEANKSIYAAGCVDKAATWIESHLLLVGALALGIALAQVTPLTALLNSAHAHTYNSPLPLVTADNSGPRKCLWRRRNNTQYTHQYWEATGDSLELSL
uniref:tetraspanin-33-like isoform X2 n=1 Tax=Gasterosteus aculeatus aculeatus TaxID=481459 RepID=UPI001A98C594|nr:tetraspanin-33-like isoform X2 [Gasterosteus aculeatus aculeatus]